MWRCSIEESQCRKRHFAALDNSEPWSVQAVFCFLHFALFHSAPALLSGVHVRVPTFL